MGAENLTVTIGTDTPQVELGLLKTQLAATDLAMYAELVKAYRAINTADKDFDFDMRAGEYGGALEMYALFTGRPVPQIVQELAADVGRALPNCLPCR